MIPYPYKIDDIVKNDFKDDDTLTLGQLIDKIFEIVQCVFIKVLESRRQADDCQPLRVIGLVQMPCLRQCVHEAARAVELKNLNQDNAAWQRAEICRLALQPGLDLDIGCRLSNRCADIYMAGIHIKDSCRVLLACLIMIDKPIEIRWHRDE